jgi:hypothetical protein
LAEVPGRWSAMDILQACEDVDPSDIGHLGGLIFFLISSHN